MPVRFAAIVLLFVLLPSLFGEERSLPPKPRRVDPAADARTAFFQRSDLDATLKKTELALKTHPAHPELLFLRMEAAALESDATTTLDAALQLCATLDSGVDPRGTIAASRVMDLAGNSIQFRQVIPRIRQLIASGSPYASSLRASLITAASEGAPGLKLLRLSHESGLLTDWQVAGPFGRYSNVDFEREWPPEKVGSLKSESQAERVRFSDGTFDLPEYFERKGIFYASGTIRFTEPVRRSLQVESNGTLQVFIDGRSVLTKDDRFFTGSQVSQADLKLSRGAHEVLVKFTPSALPFRLAVAPVQVREEKKLEGDPTVLAYISAEHDYWTGRYSSAITQLAALRKSHPSAAIDFLLASAWERSSDDSLEESNYLLSALRESPNVAAAQFRLAEKAQRNGRIDEAWQRISALIATHPDFAEAQELAADIAISRNWTVEAIEATEAVLKTHPTCSNLENAYRFFSAHAQFDRAKEVLDRIRTCAPESTTYIALLSESGEHEQATRAAAKLVLTNPLSREARQWEVRELALSGKNQEARQAAEALSAIAPNSPRFRDLATSTADMVGILEQKSRTRSEFLTGSPFYAPYRRNAKAIIRENADNNPSADAVTLLEDKVARVTQDGSVSVYFHRVMKVLTRSGIETYGEVSLPRGADLLELRTIKRDGTVAEPEFHEHKTTISMPALSPGDAIDQEYVINYADRDGISGHPNEFSFTFGWHRTAIENMRFVSITPLAENVATRELNGAPKANVSVRGNDRIQIWERSAIAKFADESNLPSRETLPTVNVFESPDTGWAGIRDYYRDMLIDASRVGPRARAAVASLRENASELDKLKSLYTFVLTHIRPDRSSFAAANVTSAEDTLATNSGNRSAALISLAHAAGLQADLVLARDISGDPPVISNLSFTRPLVRVTVAGSPTILDAESDSMAIGSISPRLDRGQALLVPSKSEPSAALLIGLGTTQSEQSVAEGTLRINLRGDLDARITIRLGASRAAQMRSTLAGVDTEGRQQFLQDLATRIFNGATGTVGEIRNERELDRPLEVSFHCRAPGYVNLNSALVEADQFVPKLGLRRMYASANDRTYPLYLDTPLVERTTFRVELPPGMHMARRVNTEDLRTSFGRYHLIARELDANTFEVTREFEIPVQVVAPAEYKNFRAFANRIDDAERQRFAFRVQPAVTTATSSPE